MPQYELMYLLGSHVADTEVPQISEQVKKFIADFGGTDIRETHLGKKKLAYPIKKTRNGYYVVVNFAMDSKNINAFDAKIRTQNTTIIRYIMVNLDEHLERLAKDQAIAAKMPRRQIPEEEADKTPAVKEAPKSKPQEQEAAQPVKTEEPALELDQEELDKKIEEALNEDLTK